MLICLFFKFSAHSSVVLKLHKFSLFPRISETVVLHENICTSTLNWPVLREMVHLSPLPSTELQYILRIGYADSGCLKEKKQTSKQKKTPKTKQKNPTSTRKGNKTLVEF